MKKLGAFKDPKYAGSNRSKIVNTQSHWFLFGYSIFWGTIQHRYRAEIQIKLWVAMKKKIYETYLNIQGTGETLLKLWNTCAQNRNCFPAEGEKSWQAQGWRSTARSRHFSMFASQPTNLAGKFLPNHRKVTVLNLKTTSKVNNEQAPWLAKYYTFFAFNL